MCTLELYEIHVNGVKNIDEKKTCCFSTRDSTSSISLLSLLLSRPVLLLRRTLSDAFFFPLHLDM